MADLQKTIKRIEEWIGAPFACDAEIDPEIVHDALELLKEQQPKTGHWKRTRRKNAYGGIEIVCSVCDDHVMVQNVGDELFCRHCGAKMENATE